MLYSFPRQTKVMAAMASMTVICLLLFISAVTTRPPVTSCLGSRYSADDGWYCRCQDGYKARGNSCVDYVTCEVDADCKGYGHPSYDYVCASYRCMLDARQFKFAFGEFATEQFETVTTEQYEDESPPGIPVNRAVMPSLVDCLGREFDPNFRGPCLCQAGYTARGNFCVNKEYCEVDDDCKAFGHAASGYICESFRCVLNASKVSVGLDQVTTEQFKDEPPTTAQLRESIGSTLEDNRPESKVPFSWELLIGTCLLVTVVGVIVILTVRAKKMATFALSSVLDLTTAVMDDTSTDAILMATIPTQERAEATN